MMRSNLVKLMAGPSPESEAAGDTKNGGDNAGDEKRRRLIVDLDPPRFGRFTGLLDVPGTLLGWAGDRYGGSNNSSNNSNNSNSSDKTQRKASPDGEWEGRGGAAEEKRRWSWEQYSVLSWATLVSGTNRLIHLERYAEATLGCMTHTTNRPSRNVLDDVFA